MALERPPLIVTAHLDEASFATLDSLRCRYFPVERNMIPAHISLFHSLPGEEMSTLSTTIATLCGETESFALAPAGLRFLGHGVAIAYAAPMLSRLRASLATAWSGWLTAQDRQKFEAHVTIQNKVAPSTAKALLAELTGSVPPACRVEGIDLWSYRGGPWDFVATFPFADVRRRTCTG